MCAWATQCVTGGAQSRRWFGKESAPGVAALFGDICAPFRVHAGQHQGITPGHLSRFVQVQVDEMSGLLSFLWRDDPVGCHLDSFWASSIFFLSQRNHVETVKLS